MGENSRIEWTDHTFNPWMGCTKVSEGCRNCYAENQMDHRWGKVQWGPGKPRMRTSDANWKKPIQWNKDALYDPRGDRPRVFCASLADWLDPEVPIEWLADLLALIQKTPNLDWLLLTKRPEHWVKRMERVFQFEMSATNVERGRLQRAWDWYHGKEAPANVWMGTTVENQKAADERIPQLLTIPARFRFLSCEPMCGPVDLSGIPWLGDPILPNAKRNCLRQIGSDAELNAGLGRPAIDWVICGGESGPNARPMHPDWARGLRDQCNVASVPFFFKQWGEWIWAGPPIDGLTCSHKRAWLARDGEVWFGRSPGCGGHSEAERRGVVSMARIGKKSAGRLLDGVQWNQFPEVADG